MNSDSRASISNRGSSPVIAVILMVAVAVALVVMVSMLVFNTADNQGKTVDATVDTKINEGNIRVTIVRNPDAERIDFGGTKSNPDVVAGPGSTGSVSVEPTESSKTVEIAAVGENESEQLLKTIDADKVRKTDSNKFVLESMSADDSVDSGDKFTADYEIKNSGESSNLLDVSLSIDGSTEDSVDHSSVSSGETVSDALTYKTKNKGDRSYSVLANGDVVGTGTFKVEQGGISPLTESPDKTISESGPISGCSRTIDTTMYNSAVVTVAGGEGGRGGYSATGGDGGQVEDVVADISNVDRLCYGVGGEGEDSDNTEPYPRDGGEGYNKGGDSDGGLSGGGGGSTIVAENGNPTNSIADASGGGGGAYSNFAFWLGLTTQSGGDGGAGVYSSGGDGGTGGATDESGQPGNVATGPLAVKAGDTSTNEGDGSVTIELYEGKLE